MSNWVSETVPPIGGTGLAHADDEVSLVKDTANNVYVVTETNDPAPNDPQVLLYKRAAAGGWTRTPSCRRWAPQSSLTASVR